MLEHLEFLWLYRSFIVICNSLFYCAKKQVLIAKIAAAAARNVAYWIMHVPGSWYIRFFNLKFVGHCQMMTNQVLLTSTFKKGVFSLVNLFLKSGSFFAWPTFELKLNKYLGWMVQKNDRNNKIHRHMVTVGLRSLLNLWNELKLWLHFFDIWYPGWPDHVQLTFWSKSQLQIFKN